MKFLCVLGVLCSLAVPAASLDREAFTFTKYSLQVRLEPEQQRMGVRGQITLRNDSAVPQQNLSLQISSSLTWRSIRVGKDPVEFVPQSYTSDIDHTGCLSEAIVTLPTAIAPKGKIQLTVGYEGIVRADQTRLKRIGVPEGKARDTDWDVISPDFTAVRGIGYVAWYPIATEAANLSDGNSVFATVERWKLRHADSSMDVRFESTFDQPILFTGALGSAEAPDDPGIHKIANYSIPRLGTDVPTFVTGNYEQISARRDSEVYYLSGHGSAAASFALSFSRLNVPAISSTAEPIQVIELPDAAAASFVSGKLLLIPLSATLSPETELDLVYALTRQGIDSPRVWLRDGLAHYAQLLSLESGGGRQAVLDYLSTRMPILAGLQKSADPQPNEASESLVNSGDDAKSQIKAMWAWWMLHDMCSEAVATFMASYKRSEDKEPSYVQRLVEARCKKDLEWFFDDWIYRDKGLPDFRVASVFPRKNLTEGYLTTVTVENLGGAAAEVPVVIHSAGGDITERLRINGKSHESVRFSTPSLPDVVTINDGSVPESDTSNNSFKIEAAVDNK
jgi:hypothetical protein